MAAAPCHYCTRPAVEECATCGRLYCAEHGEDVCLRCLSPEAATPNPAVYRGALFALAVGTLLTVFLLVRPPESKSSQDTVRKLATPTPSSAGTATPTPPGSQAARTPTPGAGTPSATASAGATASATASATITPVGERTYNVKEGDTLSSIAAANGTTVDALKAANPGLTDVIQIDQALRIPAPAR